MKALALKLEEQSPSGRLLDLDVYAPDGQPLSRRQMGHPLRRCLLCAETAPDCIRLQRHAPEAFEPRLEELLRPFATAAPRLKPERLAHALVRGAQRELDLTPKPGLVDRHDNGSHPDLSHARMQASIDLLPRYYQDLLEALRQGAPLEACVAVGLAAEARMAEAIHTNAHRGYIFLSGLLLMGTFEVEGREEVLPAAVSRLARRFFQTRAPLGTHGAALRSIGLGGLQAEAEAGLPSVFDGGWPRLQETQRQGIPQDQRGFHLLAELMQVVEDSTAVHRCGPEGLARIRRDGNRLEACLAAGQSPFALLDTLNSDYRALGLTMGGVADCLALCFALQEAAAPGGPSQDGWPVR